MRKTTWGDRARYRFDNFMARGTGALIGGLAALSLAIIAVAGAVISLTGLTEQGDTARLGFFEAAWQAMMRALDAGNIAGDTGWWLRLVMFLVTVGGIFFISSLIGVLTSGIQGRIEKLRKGRSRVVETGHTLILGWSAQVFPIVSELAVANENQRDSCIVILGERDKVEMEDAIRERVGRTGRTRVVCRSGSPIDPADLEIVNPQNARSIIVLPPEEGDADAATIKSILALTNAQSRRAEPYHIVAEIRDPANLEVARLVGREEAQYVLAGDLISRITAQTCRQSGLSIVYTELLDFGGDEIYFKEEPSLTGKALGDVLTAYEDSAVMGVRFADGRIQLNPPMDTVIAAGDRLIAISEDDDTIRLAEKPLPPADESAIRKAAAAKRSPERTLVLGWNQRAPVIIRELDAYVPSRSAVTVVSDSPAAGEAIGELRGALKSQKLELRSGDTTQRGLLESLDVSKYDHLIVLGASDDLGPQEADSKTLVTLLHLRDMAQKGGYAPSIVSEMLDARNRELAEITRADDFIVSDRLVSLMLSQVSENRELSGVFQDLFDPEGSEIYMRPAGDYVSPGKALAFTTVVESARRRGEVAIGYRIAAKSGDAAEAYGVVVNPAKSEAVTFAEQDRVIVLAEG
jgi:ion channel POLLUX/CASTOR